MQPISGRACFPVPYPLFPVTTASSRARTKGTSAGWPFTAAWTFSSHSQCRPDCGTSQVCLPGGTIVIRILWKREGKAHSQETADCGYPLLVCTK